MAQQSHKPTDETRKLARSLSGIGVPQEDICVILGVSKPTLHKHYRDDLDKGLAEANAKVAESLYRQAINGDIRAAIFWAKARMGWRETVHVQSDVTISNVVEMPAPAKTTDEWQSTVSTQH